MKTGREELIEMLNETLQILDDGQYTAPSGKTVHLKLWKEEMQSAHPILPEEVKEIGTRDDFEGTPGGNCNVTCICGDTLDCTRYLDRQLPHNYGDRPVLFLNMANAVYAGGGVRSGSWAQEESLCRKSSLLVSLESVGADPYYDYNLQLHGHLGSDGLIFTPRVEIIRDGQNNLLEETVIAAGLTCAAPKLTENRDGLTEEEYWNMFCNRIVSMLRCCAYYQYKNLVLGAWGCGAFHNDPKDVVRMFQIALYDARFHGARLVDWFDQICFAVLVNHPREDANFQCFNKAFGGKPQEENPVIFDRESDEKTTK